MPDSSQASTIERNDRNRRLLKEAFYLSKEIEESETRIRADIRKINGDFAVSLEEFFDGHPMVEWAVGEAQSELRDHAIAAVFAQLAKALKLGTKEIPGLGIGLGLLSADKGASYRAAYFDTRPGIAVDLETKKRRLRAIMLEFSTAPSVPIQPNFPDVCKHEACWQRR